MADQLDDVRAALGRSFRIDREIGTGGMAVVYLAHDLANDAPVAIKVLRDALSAVIGRARFIREVSIASQLDHPRIVRVLSSGETDGVLYAVMPYVAGETLRQRLARQKQLPITDAVTLACEVADALAYAHDKGFIHRDIKPANILLGEHGAIVTDFGIARAISSSTDEESMTTSGIVIGTPAYMAPEQAARDRDLDGRSDIYALGTVLYEMLVGDVPFPGLTSWNALARLATQPPMSPRSLRPAIPVAVERVVMRALERTPADRFQTAVEFRDALKDALNAPSKPTRSWRRVGMATLTVAAVPIAAWTGRACRDAPASLSFPVPPPTGAQFSNSLRDVPAVSPDGKDIVIAGTDSAGVPSLWLQNLASGAATRIPGTDGASMAFWSPDGKWIGAFRGRSIIVVSRDGQLDVQEAATTTSEARGGSWADNGNILYAPSSQSGIFIKSIRDKTPRQLTAPLTARGEIGHLWPQALPGGSEFLYFVASPVDSVRGIYIASGNGRNGRRIVETSASAVYSNGYLLYVHDGALVAQRLDPKTASLAGDPQVIADSVATSDQYYGVFSASRSDEVLVYASGASRDISRLTWMDSAGAIKSFAFDRRYVRNPILSNDGRFLAFESFRETDSDIQYQDLMTKASTTLSDGQMQSKNPVFSPDGSSLAFVAERPGGWTIFRQRLRRNEEPEVLLNLPHALVLMDWSQGDELVLAEKDSASNYHLVARKAGKLDEAISVGRDTGQQVGARFSRDGNYIAYVSTASGVPQVLVQRFPAHGSPWCQISPDGGYQVAWGSAPGVVYFLTSNGTMMQATIDLAKDRPPCPVAAPRPLFPTAVRSARTARSFFDVSTKDHLLLINSPSVPEGAWLTVKTQWLAAANRKP